MKGKDKRYLRSLAVNMDALYQIGKEGVTESVIKSLDEALAARELIKVRVLNNCDNTAKEIANEIADMTNSELVQVIGHNMVFYRKSLENPKIEFPA